MIYYYYYEDTQHTFSSFVCIIILLALANQFFIVIRLALELALAIFNLVIFTTVFQIIKKLLFSSTTQQKRK